MVDITASAAPAAPTPPAASSSPNDLQEKLSVLMENYFTPCLPGETLLSVLKTVSSPDRYPVDLAPDVFENQAYTQFVLRTDFLASRIKLWIEESPKGEANYRQILERIFILLGKQASRNLIAAIRVSKLLGTLPKKTSEKLSLNTKEQLKHAIGAEEFCQNRGYAYSEVAFTGGLHFDFLNSAMVRVKANRDAQNALGPQWSESVKAAHIAYELGTHMGSFKFNLDVFAAMLVIGTGKVFMHILYPKDLGPRSWAALLTEVEKLKEGKPLFLELQEAKRFSLTHSEIASLFAVSMRFCKPIEKAIRYYQTPWYLKKASPELYPIASVLCLASVLAEGKPYTRMHQQIMRDHKLTAATLEETKKKVKAK